MSVFWVVFMYALWSSVFSLGKMALEHSPPIFLTGFRMVAGAVILLGFLLLFKRSTFRISKKSWIAFGLLALFSIYLPNILEFWSLQHLSAAKTCFIYSLSPFFAVLLSYIHFGEKMNKKKWLGLTIAFLGILPVVALQDGSEELLNAFAFFSWPALAIMAAAFLSVYGWVLLRIAVKDDDTSPVVANGMSMLLGGAMALIHSSFTDTWAPIPVASVHLAPFLKGIAIIIVISNLICYNLYGMALKRYTATFLSFVGLLSPIFASLNEWILLGTPPSWIIFMGTAIVSSGLWLVYQAELKQGYIVKSGASRAEEPDLQEQTAPEEV